MKIRLYPLFALTVIGGSAQSAEANKPSEVAGTYELIICKSACSFSDPRNVFARAILVLFDHAIAQKDVDRIDPFYHWQPDERANGCYMLKRNTEAQSFAGSFPGMQRTGVTPWLLRGHTLEFDLFHSPDAGYVVEVERNGDVLRGKGHSWGAGVANPGFSPDLVVGRRRGPPDMSACTPEN